MESTEHISNRTILEKTAKGEYAVSLKRLGNILHDIDKEILPSSSEKLKIIHIAVLMHIATSLGELSAIIKSPDEDYKDLYAFKEIFHHDF